MGLSETYRGRTSTLDRLAAAVADPTRRLILERLHGAPGLTTGELAALAPRMTRFSVMKHVRVLERAGLLRVMDDGRRRRHFAELAALAALRTWLAGFEAPAAGPDGRPRGSGGTS